MSNLHKGNLRKVNHLGLRLLSLSAALALSPIGAVVLTGEIDPSGFETRYNDARIVFGSGAHFKPSSAPVTIGNKTHHITNTNNSALGSNKDHPTLQFSASQPSVLIENYGRRTESVWTLGVELNKSGKQQLTFNNYGRMEGKFAGKIQAESIMAKDADIRGVGQIVFNNLGQNSRAEVFILAGDESKSAGEFQGNSRLDLYNEGTIEAPKGTKGTNLYKNAISVLGEGHILNKGVIRGGIAGLTGNSGDSVAGQGKLYIKNYGLILDDDRDTNDAIVVASADNRITNYGHIDTIHMRGSKSAISVANLGSVGSFFIDGSAAPVITLEDGFAFEAGKRIRISGDSGAKATIKLVGGKNHHFLINVGKDTKIGKAYNTDQVFDKTTTAVTFFDGGDQKIDESQLPSIIASNLTLADPLYTLSISGTNYRIGIAPQRSVGAFRNHQTLATFTSLSSRLQSVLGRIMDGNVSIESNSSKRSLTPLAYLAQASKMGNEIRSDAPTPLLDSQGMGSAEFQTYGWNTFLIPYFTFLDLNPAEFDPMSVKMGGLIAGATKKLENSIQVGFHFGVEYNGGAEITQRLARTLPVQMAYSGLTYSLGLHTKVPFKTFDLSFGSLTPFLRSELTGMLLQSKTALSPSNEKTLEEETLSGAMSLDVLGGAELKMGFGSLALETGFSQQVLHLSKLSFTGFYHLDSQNYEAQTLAPLRYLLQAQYGYEFAFSHFTLTPRAKMGLQTTLVGRTLQTSIRLSQGNFRGTQTLDPISGIFEAGLDFEFKNFVGFELNYMGEYGAKVQSHTVDVKLGMKF